MTLPQGAAVSRVAGRMGGVFYVKTWARPTFLAGLYIGHLTKQGSWVIGELGGQSEKTRSLSLANNPSTQKPSYHVHPAVHVQRFAGDVARTGRSEESDRVRDIGGRT